MENIYIWQAFNKQQYYLKDLIQQRLMRDPPRSNVNGPGWQFPRRHSLKCSPRTKFFPSAHCPPSLPKSISRVLCI